MDKQPQTSKLSHVNSSKTAKKISRKVVIDTVIATVIAMTPILFTLHESVPSQQVWSTSFFTYDSKLWLDAQYAMWVFTGKAIPLLLLILWFFTNKHWWYHALLVPIIMYTFQIIGSYQGDTNNIDEFQFVYMLPIMAIIIPSIYLVRARIFDKINSKDKSMEELEEEFMIKPKGVWGTVKQYF